MFGSKIPRILSAIADFLVSKVIPVLLAVCWIYFFGAMSASGSLVCTIMLALDCWGFFTLLGHKEVLRKIAWKRLLLLICDIALCTVFAFLTMAFKPIENSSFLSQFFFIYAPPLLFMFNIWIHNKNCADKKMLRSLIFTDPLLHYMGVFIWFYASEYF